MPIFTGLSGQGQALLRGGDPLTILEVSETITTMGPLVHIDGPASFARLHQAGWVGVGYTAGGVGYDLIYWGEFVDYPNRVWRIYPLQVYADSYFWDLAPGVVLDLEVVW